ncbi:MAG: hypothetical protein ACPGVB_12545, partial [Chitinophagales bacterium]
MKLLEKYPITILLLFSFGVTFLIWGDVIWHINDYLFAPYGDGMKNYYAPAYYIKYGGRLTFSGMGYPYNSYLMYADPMPILAIPLHWINESLFSIENYTIGVVNAMMIFSVIPCILFLFLIMRHYRLPVWYAMIAALLIAHLSPQYHRILGHFALSMLTFVPAIWYILLRQTSSTLLYRWGFLQVAVLLFFTFIHAYYLLIGVVFILAYVLVYIVQYSFKKQVNWRQIRALIFSALSPIIFFKVFQILTDSTTDMHTVPYGFFVYYAELKSVFFTTVAPLAGFWRMFYNHPPQFEGFAYVGLMGVFALFFTGIKGFLYLKNGEWSKIIHPVLPTNLSISIWAAVVVLLYSMCIPFRYGFEFLLDYLPQLQQFRSLGRFAWIFYYIFTVYTVFYFYLIFRRMSIKGVKSIAGMMLFLGFVIWSMEAYYFILSKKDYIVEVNHVDHDFYGKTTDYKNVLAEKGYKVEDFQAIMVFPYFNVGSEKIYVTERGSGGLYMGCKASYHTGLAMNSTFLGRYSINRAMKMGQLMSVPLIEKEILKDYPNNKPLLLVAHGKKFLPDEQRILEKAKLIYQKDEESLYELPLSAFDNNKDEIKLQFAAQKDSIFQFQTSNSKYWSSDSTNSIVINHFEEGNYSDALFGKKALQQETGEMVLFEGKMPNAKAGQLYLISVWVKSDDKHAAFPDFSYKQFNIENAEIAQIYYDPKDRLDIYKDWVRADHLITIHHPDNLIKVSLVGDNI